MIGLHYVSQPSDLGEPDLIIVPGAKSTMDDLVWMRSSGLEAAVLKLAARDVPVIGVCGGYQMLGEELLDPDGVESQRPSMRGMGLLPTTTTFNNQKTRTRVQALTCAGPLAGAHLDSYEIHMGLTEIRGEPFCHLTDGTPDGCRNGNVFGTYLHGLFDSGELTGKLVAWLCQRKGLDAKDAAAEDHWTYQERQYDLLADGLRHALDMDAVYRILDGKE